MYRTRFKVVEYPTRDQSSVCKSKIDGREIPIQRSAELLRPPPSTASQRLVNNSRGQLSALVSLSVWHPMSTYSSVFCNPVRFPTVELGGLGRPQYVRGETPRETTREVQLGQYAPIHPSAGGLIVKATFQVDSPSVLVQGISNSSDANRGIICGWKLGKDGGARELDCHRAMGTCGKFQPKRRDQVREKLP